MFGAVVTNYCALMLSWLHLGFVPNRKETGNEFDSYGKLLHKLNVRIEFFCYVIVVFLSYLNDMTKFNYQFIYTFIHFAFLFVTTPIFFEVCMTPVSITLVLGFRWDQTVMILRLKADRLGTCCSKQCRPRSDCVLRNFHIRVYTV